MRDASTVLALRPGDDEVEIFMVKRSSRMGFLGGRHVFPGGAVDAEDGGQAMAAVLDGADAGALADAFGFEDQARAQSLVVAALRELFEEAGILLAHDGSGQWVDLDDGSPRAERLSAARPSVAAGEDSFSTLLAAEGLRLGGDALVYFAHWITPEMEKKRFDTRFFLAPMPGGQQAVHDEIESAEGGWMSPSVALARYRAREIELVPPTIVALDRLAGVKTLEEAADRARNTEIVSILPKISTGGALITILYPGDDDYEQGNAGPNEPGRNLHRLVLRDGLWEQP